MFKKSSEPITYEYQEGFDNIIDEKGNSFLALRKIRWGDAEEYKLDLRKYYNSANGEVMGKGVGFLTDEGPHELVRTMTELGYGDTKEILTSIKDRDDFRSSLNKVLGGKDEFYDPEVKDDSEDQYYDPKLALLGSD